MKKITLVFLLISLVCVSFAQFPLALRELAGHEKLPVQVIDNSNRSVPPGNLIYSQPCICPPTDGFGSKEDVFDVADDFILTSSSSVNIVRWWWSFPNVNLNTTAWTIKIYNNQSCLPSSLVGTWNITAADVTYENVCTFIGWPVYDTWAGLTPAFIPLPNVNYWISIAPAGGVSVYWIAYGNPGDYLNCPGVVKSSNPSYHPEFTDIEHYKGYHEDFTFELYSTETPPVETPVSNWAIGLGIFLILGLAALRFRRIF
jgi:hypothetical protein